jgi:hypothetical protein
MAINGRFDAKGPKNSLRDVSQPEDESFRKSDKSGIHAIILAD